MLRYPHFFSFLEKVYKSLTSSEMNDIVTYNASFAKMIILKRKASDIPDSEIAMHINIKNK